LNDDSIKASLKQGIPFYHNASDLYFLATEFGWPFRREGMMLIRSVTDAGLTFGSDLKINDDDSKERFRMEYEDAWPKPEPVVKKQY
jgi:hypothetical protein